MKYPVQDTSTFKDPVPSSLSYELYLDREGLQPVDWHGIFNQIIPLQDHNYSIEDLINLLLNNDIINKKLSWIIYLRFSTQDPEEVVKDLTVNFTFDYLSGKPLRSGPYVMNSSIPIEIVLTKTEKAIRYFNREVITYGVRIKVNATRTMSTSEGM